MHWSVFTHILFKETSVIDCICIAMSRNNASNNFLPSEDNYICQHLLLFYHLNIVYILFALPKTDIHVFRSVLAYTNSVCLLSSGENIPANKENYFKLLHTETKYIL